MNWRYVVLLPVWIVLADLWWGVVRNVQNALVPIVQPLPQDGLPVAPEFAFGWIQVLVNGGMVCLLTWAVGIAVWALRRQWRGESVAISGWLVLSLLLLLAFTLPAWWQGFWAIWVLLQGKVVVDGHVHDVFVMLCQLGMIILPVWLWSGYRRKHVMPITSLPENHELNR